jgi:hypothetical protein
LRPGWHVRTGNELPRWTLCSRYGDTPKGSARS